MRGPGPRQAFIDALLAVRGAVAIGVRADICGKLVSHPELVRVVAANQLPLGAMSEDELERAVTEPARLAGLRLEPGLVELVVREVGRRARGAAAALARAARRLGAPRRTHPDCRGLPRHGPGRQVGADVNLGQPVAPRAMSFSPDGRTLMVMAVDGIDRSTLEAIDVWIAPGPSASELAGTGSSPPLGSDGVAYSPDGRLVAVSLIQEANSSGIPSAAQVLIVDMATGRIRWQRAYPIRSSVQEEPHVAFTPSGVLLTSAQHGDTILWDPATGRILRRFPMGGLPAISADGREVALGRNTSFLVQ